MEIARESLLPWPQKFEKLAENARIQRVSRVRVSGLADAAVACEHLTAALSRRGPFSIELGVDGEACAISVSCDAAFALPPEGYELWLRADGIAIQASTPAGAFYGVCTLAQLIALAPRVGDELRLPGLAIADAPDFAVRGVMLDVSRDRVPRMQTLFELVDLLAGMKLNQLQLYMEHTFAYAAHEAVWRQASPFTAQEIRELDRYAKARFIELVPNQNSFGHMARWLTKPGYLALAECPNGFEHPWNPTREPYGLCPIEPKSLEFLDRLYAELLPNFSSAQFNVGLDETIDLGLGRSAEACRERGTERVYLEFLQQIHALVQSHGKRMQFWGDIINKRPELIPELPKEAIALEWGYEADHPFREHSARFRESSLSFYVCPGTSSWNSIGGRSRNALLNICRAATAGHEHGATGVLTTDWGDNGHLQPLPVSYLGFAAGALVSWNASAAQIPDALPLPALLDAHVFFDTAGELGKIAWDLGQAAELAGAHVINNSLLFSLLTSRDPHFDAKRVSHAELEAARALVHAARSRLALSRSSRADAELVSREFSWVADALECACALGDERLEIGFENALSRIPSERRNRLVAQLGGLLERHSEIWLARSRPGGLRESRARLEHTLSLLVAP